MENFEVRSIDVQGPFPHHDRFAVVFRLEVTHTPKDQRMVIEEVQLYTVRDGKIVRAEFFYSGGG